MSFNQILVGFWIGSNQFILDRFNFDLAHSTGKEVLTLFARQNFRTDRIAAPTVDLLLCILRNMDVTNNHAVPGVNELVWRLVHVVVFPLGLNQLFGRESYGTPCFKIMSCSPISLGASTRTHHA